MDFVKIIILVFFKTLDFFKRRFKQKNAEIKKNWVETHFKNVSVAPTFPLSTFRKTKYKIGDRFSPRFLIVYIFANQVGT